MSATGDAPGAPDAGTTLIEALVVVAIMAMMAVIGFPQLRQTLALLAQRETVAVVTARLREARALALRRDAPVLFAVTGDGLGYATTGAPVTRAPPGVVLASKSGAPGDATGAIAFFGDGSSTGGAVWVGAGRRTIPVYVAPGTGVVAVGGS
jgi:general secretion pathway protein H